MHALKDYVQAAVLRTSETVARGSTKQTDNGQKILNALKYFMWGMRWAERGRSMLGRPISNLHPSFFLGMGELHHVPEKKISSSTTIKNSNNGPQVRFETVSSM